MKSVSWVNLVLGVWLLCAPWVLHSSGLAMANSILMGVIVIAIAALSLLTRARNHVPAWFQVAAGFWVFFSPWALGINHETSIVVTSTIAGALIIIFSLVRGSAGEPAIAGHR
ncbi:MAG TPA: SPW repeat protein [Vicinamibacterales bacterium]|nr:SPW repeat protein [Vicinamibacterales bacterium]